MKAKALAPMAAMLAFLLAAVPAAAEHRSHDGDSGIAQLARRIEKTTNELYRDVARSRPWGFAHWRSVAALRNLDQRAQRFENRVSRSGIRDDRAQREFRELEQALRYAKGAVRHFRGRAAIERELDRVDRLVGQLDTRIARLERRDDRRYAQQDRRHGDRYARAR